MFSMSTSARLLDKLPSTQPSQVCFATFLAKPNCVRTLGRATRFTSDQEGPPCRKARSSKRGTAVVMIRDFPNGFGTSDDNDITTDIPMQRPPQPKRALDELVDFPCVFTVKVVGIREGEFVDDIRSAVAKVLNTERRHLKTSFRDRGKYRSITLNVPVNSADQIYDVYAAIDMDERVKFKF